MAIDAFITSGREATYTDWVVDIRRNLALDPVGALPTSTSWNVNTLFTASADPTPFAGLPSAARFTRATTGSGRIGIAMAVADWVPSLPYTIRFQVQASVPFTVTTRLRPNVSAATNEVAGVSLAIPAGLSAQQVTINAPAVAAGALPGLALITSSGLVGATLDITGVIIEQATSVGTFFYGGQADTDTTRTYWVGTPNASVSTLETRTLESGVPGARPGQIFGGIGNISNYAVNQDATPISATSSSPSTPSLMISAQPRDLLSALRMKGSNIALQDTDQRGVTNGVVESVTLSEDSLEIEATTVLTKLVGRVIVPPFTGTLGSYLSGLVARLDGDVATEFRGGIGAIPVVLPALSGTGWDIMTEVCVAYQVEVAMAGAAISFRPIRGAVFTYERLSHIEHRIEDGRRARYVDATFYDTIWDDSGLIYPRLSDESNKSSFPTAGPNQRLLVDIGLTNVSISYVNQPVCVASTVDVDNFGASCYTVLDRNNAPVDPLEWTQGGGAVRLTVSPEGDVIHVAFITPPDRARAPFSLARLDADKNPEYSLRIYGAGAFMTPHTVRFNTGAADDEVLEELGATLDGPANQTPVQAYTAAAYAALEFSSPTQTLSATVTMPKLVELSQDWASVIFSELDIQIAGMSFTAFNAMFAGMSFDQFNDSLASDALTRFSGQLFTTLVGGRLRYGEAYFRITSVRIDPEGMRIDAVADTTVANLETSWAGKTWADQEPFLSTMTWGEWEVIPLVEAVDL